jgi:hypothetical protein
MKKLKFIDKKIELGAKNQQHYKISDVAFRALHSLAFAERAKCRWYILRSVSAFRRH